MQVALALVLLACLQLGASLTPSPAVAQGNGTPSVFLALLDVYPDVDGRVLLLREPGREIIVLAAAATPEDLSVAVTLLARFRRERGQPESGRGHMIPIVGYAPPPALSGERRAALEAALLQLRARYQYDMAPPTSGTQEEIVERYWKHLQELLSTEHTQRIEALGKPKESSKSG